MEMSTESGNEPKNNKKRKRAKTSRFLGNAKFFAKKGIFGRGTHIEDDQYSYFINIVDAMKEGGFEDAEDKVTMADNVFEQTVDQEVHLACNQIVCKVLETLVGHVSAENLERYFKVFAANFRPLCSDRFASHVLQKMVEIAFLRVVGNSATQESNVDDADANGAGPKRAKIDMLCEETYNLHTDFSDEHRQSCRDFVERVGKFLLNNLEDFVWDSCASHIMRTALLCLAGVHVPKVAFKKGGADMAKNRKLYAVPPQWAEIVREYPARLEMWPHFSDFPYNEHSSALLSVICLAVKTVDKNTLKHFGKKILMEGFLNTDSVDNNDGNKSEKIEISDEQQEQDEYHTKKVSEAQEQQQTENVKDHSLQVPLAKVFHFQSSVILLETLISVAGPKLLTQLYAMLFTGRIVTLVRQQQTNFAVQKLLQHIKEKEDFEQICNELLPHLDELLKIGYMGVLSSLSAACLRLSTKQSQVTAALQSMLHITGDKDKLKLFPQCLLELKPYEVVRESKGCHVQLHGSLVLQHLLQFNKPIVLVNCLLEMPADQLLAVLNTPNGSRVADAFLSSKFIGEKSRERFVRHMENYYVELAVNKFGSHVLEHLFAAAQEPQKLRIVKSLAEKTNMLQGTPFGRLIYNKLRIETYRLSAAQWKASLQQKSDKAEQLFKDIIN